MPNTVVNVRHLTINDIYRGQVLVVSPDGNLVDPIRGFSNMSMFTTIKAAVDSATSGDLIYVLPGTYNENRLIKDNINYYFCQGAKLWFTGTPIIINNNEDIISGSNITIDGFGDFRYDYNAKDEANAPTYGIFNFTGGTNTVCGYKAYSRNFIMPSCSNSATITRFEFNEVGLITNTINYTLRDNTMLFIILSGKIITVNIDTLNLKVLSNSKKYVRIFNPNLQLPETIYIKNLNFDSVNNGTDALAPITCKTFNVDTINMVNSVANGTLIYSSNVDNIEIGSIISIVVHNIIMVGKLGFLKIKKSSALTNISYVSTNMNLMSNNAIIDVFSCKNLTICGNYTPVNNNLPYNIFLNVNSCEEIFIGSEILKTIFLNNLECTKITTSISSQTGLTINPELHFYGNVKINLIVPSEPAINNGYYLYDGSVYTHMLRFYNYGNVITNSTNLYTFGGSVYANIIDNPTIHKTPGYKWSGATAILESGGIPSRGLYDNQII